jgi:hypothetical protein
MLERLRDPHFRGLLTDIRDRVKSGEELSAAFAAYGDMRFRPTLDPQGGRAHRRASEAVIRRFIRYLAGARSAQEGDLGAGLSDGAGRTVDRHDRRRMTVFVVPKFTVFFEDMEVELPLLTRITLGLLKFITAYWPWIVGALVVAYGRCGAGRTAAGRRPRPRSPARASRETSSSSSRLPSSPARSPRCSPAASPGPGARDRGRGGGKLFHPRPPPSHHPAGARGQQRSMPP